MMNGNSKADSNRMILPFPKPHFPLAQRRRPPRALRAPDGRPSRHIRRRFSPRHRPMCHHIIHTQARGRPSPRSSQRRRRLPWHRPPRQQRKAASRRIIPPRARGRPSRRFHPRSLRAMARFPVVPSLEYRLLWLCSSQWRASYTLIGVLVRDLCPSKIPSGSQITSALQLTSHGGNTCRPCPCLTWA